MEIPYIVTPRKDTGLYNAKIAIWLFLASEVMLFGGFFSAYVFLRLGADYPWPERTLPVLPGLINTFILIASSVTVVFAWASLKLRQWGRFQLYMGFTVLCSFVFLGLKGIEYNVKFHHQAVRLHDYSVVEGHLGKVKDSKGNEMEENVVNFETSQISFNTVRFYKPWVKELLFQAEEAKAKITLASDITLKKDEKSEAVTFKAGTELSESLLKQIADLHIAARAHNSAVRTENFRGEWAKAHEENPDKKGWEIADKVSVNTAAIADKLVTEQPAIAFNVSPAVAFHFAPRDIQAAATSSTLRDGTALTGKLLESEMVFHAVDAIDFRHTAMKAEAKGIDPEVAIENSWLIKNNPEIKEAWEWHKEQIKKLSDDLAKHGRYPTDTEKYRMGWKDFAARAEGKDMGGKSFVLKEEFFGPDYEARHGAFPELKIPRAGSDNQVLLDAKFSPAWNTYYAIYFTMTGLHGLHVIGGAIVLGYYLFFGRKMYLSNPEWLANRVEVGGLFWHFVDLVWIFLFPILYLM
jgi:heme/copper-type cytochrome/quinol oxidase subunit 3